MKNERRKEKSEIFTWNNVITYWLETIAAAMAASILTKTWILTAISVKALLFTLVILVVIWLWRKYKTYIKNAAIEVLLVFLCCTLIAILIVSVPK